jgi:hypothetical protein
MDNLTLNNASYAKSYKRLSREIFAMISSEGSIDNLFRDSFFRGINYRTQTGDQIFITNKITPVYTKN